MCSFVTTSDEKDYEQATGLWKVIGREPGHQDRFVENVAGSVRKVKSKELREDVYGMFFFLVFLFPVVMQPLGLTCLIALFGRVNSELGERLRASTEAKIA